MIRITRVLFLLALIVGMLTARLWPTYAQQDQSTTLTLLQPVTGEINDSQVEQRWTFTASKGQRLSMRMQATSGDLEPSIELLDAAGKSLASSGSGSYRNATIDAFVIPDAGTYAVRVTRAKTDKPTSGGYSLSLLPGFSFLLINDPTGARSPMRVWREPNALAQFSEGKLRLQLTADNSYTFTTADKIGVFKDLYMQAEMQAEPISGYWEGGLLLRGTRRNNALEFYLFFINSDNKWRLAYGRPGGMAPIHDWTALPGTLQATSTLGAMLKGHHFILFYNGQPLSELDDETLGEAGVFGVAIGTGRSPSNSTSVLFDNIVVTLPTDEAASVPIIVPPRLMHWQQTALSILEELLAARIIPSIGKPGLDVADAFVTNNTAKGIVVQPLARSISFTDLVYTADVSWESNNENIACGMEFRAADDKNFSIVYLDRKGGFGILQRSEKDGDIVSMYNLSDAIKKDNRATNRVTIIAIGNSLMVYINGGLVANMNGKQVAGSTFIAAYNYERASSVCQFKNVWLRAFDR